MTKYQTQAPKYLASSLVTCFAAFCFINTLAVLGVPALTIALGLATSSQYIVFDFQTGYQGNFTQLFGLIPLGGWQKLPQIQYVILKPFAELISEFQSEYGGLRKRKEQRYVILFSIKNSAQGWIILEEANLIRVRQIATEIATEADFKLIDYTGTSPFESEVPV